MPDDKQLGAHGGGIPPGWDFPEARAAADQGLDLWLLDRALRRTPTERLRAAAEGARFMAAIKQAGLKLHGT